MTATLAAVALIALLLILPLRGLRARRVPLRRSALLALTWAAIFAAATLIVTLVRR